jgi:hypothetical protein
MPAPPIFTSPARSLLLNGLMQSNLDANGFQILNLDTSNLTLGGPNGQPVVPHNWIHSYDTVSRNFGIAQPATIDLSDWPSVTGQSGKILSNNGIALLWTSGLGSANGFLNIKDPPYNAVGDGVHDDSAAIQAAVNASVGRTVYIPKGNYYLATPVTVAAITSILGDGYKASVLIANTGSGGQAACLNITGPYVTVAGLGFNGNLPAYVQQSAISLGVVQVSGSASWVTIRGCKVFNSTGIGISIINALDCMIQDTDIENCPTQGLNVLASPRLRISKMKIFGTTQEGIRISDSVNCSLLQCRVAKCGALTPGIHLLDSDYSVLIGNSVTQCAFGIVCEISPGRSISACGYVVTSNNVYRNYSGGIKFSLAHGFQCSDNNVVDNAQGGFDSATYTIEPGVIVSPAAAGTGYLVGDILSLVGGTGSPTKLIVTSVKTGGVLSVDCVHPAVLGAYTALPPETTTATGGHGSGANFIFSGSRISNVGASYYVGEVLRSTIGPFTNPVRLMVTSTTPTSGPAGQVTGYEILDGGGFNGILPATLTFVSESLADSGGTGTGFVLTPGFGRRYSTPFNGYVPFGICTYGPITSGMVSGNIVSNNKLAPGILVQDDVAPFNGRASYIWGSGNSLYNNHSAISGDTVGSPIDTNLGTGSIWAPNIVYPPGT